MHDYCIYKHSAITEFQGIDWSSPKEVANLQNLATKLQEKSLQFRRELLDYSRDQLKMPDDMMVSCQEQAINELIEQLSFYQAVAAVLEFNLRMLKKKTELVASTIGAVH